MSRTFDLIVIGSGSAASTVASRCRAAGWSVAMADKQPFGGTCALRGCEPKKVLVGAAAAVDAARALSAKGIRTTGLAIDWPDLMRFKRTFTTPVPERRKAALAKEGIEAFDGTARFVGPARLTVGDQQFDAARAIVVAAGARPADLPIEGREHLATSDRFLDLDALPPSIAFVGGGFISFEFAHVAARAGVRATILHRGLHPLAGFDPDLADRLVARTRDAGVDVRLEAPVHAIERRGTRYRVTCRTARGDVAIETDLVIHGAGHIADLDDLHLDAAGVQFSHAGVHVNDSLQSVSNPLVWAAGDCAATRAPRLTPVAEYQGRIVAANLLEGHHTPADYRVVPSVVFTVPPLARAGLTEEDARARQIDLAITHEDTSGWYSSRRVAEPCSAFKILIDKNSDQIVGAHLLGPQADETINVFAMAMCARLTKRQLKEMLWAYPTHGSDIPYMSG